jgi:hypothetical protein
MRLALAALSIVLLVGGTAHATDLRAPDQQAPSTGQPAVTDLRAPDQQAGPTQQPAPTTDLRAPDQQAPATAPTPPASTTADDGPDPVVFMLIGLAVALVLLAGAYVVARYRHRPAIADDLVVD